MMIKNSLVLLLLFCLPVFVMADDMCQTGEQNIPASTPTSQFPGITAESQVVTDKKTDLMWTRCPWGYKWGLGGCAADADLLAGYDNGSQNWGSALEITLGVKDTYLGFAGWRMPNIKELASIVERRCAGLAMNQVIFGNKTPGKYWSNTHIVGGVSIRVIDFSSGQLDDAATTNDLFFRLVRDVTP